MPTTTLYGRELRLYVEKGADPPLLVAYPADSEECFSAEYIEGFYNTKLAFGEGLVASVRGEHFKALKRFQRAVEIDRSTRTECHRHSRISGQISGQVLTLSYY